MFDSRTESNLATLTPYSQQKHREFLTAIFASDVLPLGHTVKIISGTRSYAEQDRLFAQGRTKPGPIVTNARGGFSNHNGGSAADYGIFKGKDYLEDSPLYNKLGPIGESVGLNWGGRWSHIVDLPHYEVPSTKSLAETREIIKANGGDITKPEAQAAIDKILVHKSNDFIVTPKDINVDVYLKTKKLDVKAFLRDSRTYVGVRDFVTYLGGSLGPVVDSKVEFTFHDKEISLSLVIVDNVGYAKFADVNALLGYTFTFDGKNNKLVLSI